MKIVHIMAGMEQTSGIAKVACRLADVQAARGHDVAIATTDCAATVHPVDPRVKVMSWPRSWPRRLCRSSGMRRELPALLAGADVAIVHSMWLWPVWFGAACARRVGAKVFMMPHGCLDPVKRAYHGGRKRLVGWLDRRAFARCDAVIATDARERVWVQEWAPSGTRVEVVPLGVDLPNETPPDDTNSWLRAILGDGVYVWLDNWCFGDNPKGFYYVRYRLTLKEPFSTAYDHPVLIVKKSKLRSDQVEYMERKCRETREIWERNRKD